MVAMARSFFLDSVMSLATPNHPNDACFQVPAGSGVDEEILKLVGLGDNFEVSMPCKALHDVLHLLLELEHNEGGNQLIGQGLLLQKRCDLCGFIVLLLDVPIDIDPSWSCRSTA